MKKFDILDVIENKFHFGIGGLGDFALLMSTFYDDIDSNTDVVFVCNDTTTIRKFSRLFPLVNRFWFYPRKAFYIDEFMWKEIYGHKLCIGTGVTPKNFDYVNDWIECGKTDVFQYYGVKEHPMFAMPIPTKEKSIVIQPYGGSDDETKVKAIPHQDILKIISSAKKKKYNIAFIGSKTDKAERKSQWDDDIKWIVHIQTGFKYIQECEKFYGADSWGKTIACFAGKETHVFPNKYAPGREPLDLFNHSIDPGDYVFLKGWKLEIVG